MSRGRTISMVVWAALAPLSATGGDTADASRRSVVPRAQRDILVLEWLDISRVTGGVDGIARSETRSILKEAGVDVVWRQGDGRSAARPGEIRIILLDRLHLRPDTGSPVLGATPSDRRQAMFAWIHVKSVRAALGLAVDAPSQGLDVGKRRDLGVALGRVIAHEVVHALAPSVHHGEELMSEYLCATELTGPSLRVEASVADALRAALRGEARPLDRLSAAGAPPSSLPRGVAADPLFPRSAADRDQAR